MSNLTLADVDTPANRAVALQITEESIVLLRNKNSLLPLPPGLRRVAVVGPEGEPHIRHVVQLSGVLAAG